jgi:hypothetical protein
MPFHRITRSVATAALALGLPVLSACGETPATDVHDIHDTAAFSRMAGKSPDVNRQLAELRRVTAAYHNFDAAIDAGWEARITPCWEHSEGAMGFHYANPAYLFDGGRVDLLEPEALMYEPGPGGQMRLVGMEYIVFIDDWTGQDPPELLGQPFHPHSFLPIYKLHIWLWRDNPRGIFADWNPKVSCEHADETESF